MSIENCTLLDLPKIFDTRGNLTFIESDNHIPFNIQRVFYIYDVPGGSERGAHAHHQLKQFIIAVSGSFDVMIDNGFNKNKITLNRSYHGLYIQPMTWCNVENFSSGSVCLVLASAPYNENDYIRDYNDFLKYTKEKNANEYSFS